MSGLKDTLTGGLIGGKLLGGGPEVPEFSPEDAMLPFNAGGLSGKWVDGAYTVSPTQQRTDLLNSLRSSFQSQADLLRNQLAPQASGIFQNQLTGLQDLISKVQPGFGDLTKARNDVFQNALTRLQGARTSAVGDLKSNLERRNVLGSSFGQDAIIRAGAEYDMLDKELSAQQAEVNAQSFLQELELTNNLLNQQYDTSLKELGTAQQLLQGAIQLEGQGDAVLLDDLNKLAEIGSNLINSASSSYSNMLMQQQQLAAESASSYGAGLGSLISGGINMAGGKSGTIGGMDAGQLASMASTAAMMFSDVTLKENIVPADIKNGFRRYIYSYIGDPVRYIGVMAQEVKEILPEAVKKVGDYLAVDYSKLGFDREVASW